MLVSCEIEEYNFMTGRYPVNDSELQSFILNDTVRFPDGPPQCKAFGAYTINATHRAQCTL